MNLLEVANYLQTQGMGTVGQDIFVTEMPASCTAGILLMHRYSTHIDHELPGWRDTGFRLVTRHGSYASGEALASMACDKLTITQDLQMGSLLVRRMLPQTEPRPYRRSDGAVWEFEAELETIYIVSS